MRRKGAEGHRAGQSGFDIRVLIESIRGIHTTRALALRLGVDRGTVHRWMNGTISPLVDAYDADRMACMIGLHPFEIWGEDWWTNVGAEQPTLFE